MEYTDTPTYKPIAYNPFEQYYKQVSRVFVKGDNRAITGEVIRISEKYLTLEHLDRRTTLVKIEDISSISIITPRAGI
jgi:hypothetical protein